MYEVLNQVLVEQRLRELRAEAEHARLVRIARSGRRPAGLRSALGSALIGLGAHLQGKAPDSASF